ncbi:MAG: PEP-CTERM sorting domain-containing protein [candidate division Zixibacteria bacterium]|nr:PEP-CTERM sorting domain-containing protein [candidate division Zixibacteria bacterium]
MKAVLKISLLTVCIIALAMPAFAFNNTYTPNGNNSNDTNNRGNYNDVNSPLGATSGDTNKPLAVLDMIGDNDGFGYGQDYGEGFTLPFTDDPAEGAGWMFDNRSEAEKNATNGAQATDVEDFYDVSFKHKFNIYDFEDLSRAYFTIDIAGLQQGVFGGYSHLYIDGVEITEFLDINLGTWGSAVFTYEVDIEMLRDGELDVYFDNYGGNDSYYGDDHFAIDFTALAVKGTASNAVPEPTTMLLMGIGMAGLGVYRKYKK